MSFADEMDLPAETRRKKTHRGRRGKGKGPKPTDHHAEAKTHLANAHQAATPKAATQHLFKALGSLKRAAQAQPEEQANAL